ncbi:hypothetical protein B0T19DRAFT_271635 [Cercophora scortea]|uniref:C2H2-type domain-containing protein n=1 Tax=Cercophora scortea TaxID=314031 RepID=A0AAE0I758_9PEZI|nr:hypothetical protein B0T19DRAFT_271635 [Cercophora scortea]
MTTPSVPTSGPTPLFNQDQTQEPNLKKRKLGMEHPPSTGKLDHKRLLACPYHRADPERYQECRNKRFATMNHLYMHIRDRVHCPPLHCPTCYMLFPTGSTVEKAGKLRPAEARKEHIRKKECQKGTRPPAWDELGFPTEEQLLMLAKSPLGQTLDPGSVVARQWYFLRNVLFPDSATKVGEHLVYYSGTPQSEFLTNKRRSFEPRVKLYAANLKAIGLEGQGTEEAIERLLDQLLQDFITHATHKPGAPHPSPAAGASAALALQAAPVPVNVGVDVPPPPGLSTTRTRSSWPDPTSIPTADPTNVYTSSQAPDLSLPDMNGSDTWAFSNEFSSDVMGDGLFAEALKMTFYEDTYSSLP